MRRPLVLVGFCTLLTLTAAVFLGEKVSFLLLWVCLAGFGGTFVWYRTRRAVVFPLAFLTAAVALGAFCLYSHLAVDPPQKLAGQDAEIEGVVCELPYRQYGRWYYVVQTESVSISGAPQRFKIRVSSQNGLSVEPYSRIRAKVHLFLPEGGEGYNSRSYYASRGIMLFSYLYEYDGVQILPPDEKPLYSYALRLRQAMLDSVDSLLPAEEAALVKGVFLGDTTSLSEQTATDFRADGITHILSVSGLHMSTVAELLILLLAFLRVPKKPAAAAAGAGVFAFMAVTGFVPSVARSGLMCLLYLLAPLLSRRADPLNSLCAAALTICLTNPLAAADIGLLLSFFATLGLILLTGPITRFLNAKLDRVKVLSPLVRGVNGVLATSAAATLFTLPIIILSFGTVSVISPLSNLLELVPSTLMISLSAFAAALNLLLPHTFLALPFALGAGLLAKYMLVCAHWLAGIPFASISASVGFVKLWLAGTLLLFAAALLLSKRNRLLHGAAWLSVIVLLIGILSYQAMTLNVVSVAVLDVGTAEAVAVTCNGHAAVVGCGGYNPAVISNHLNGSNVRHLDYLQTLTQDHDEASNFSDLSARFGPGQVAVNQADRAEGFVQQGESDAKAVTVYTDSAEAELWGRVKVETVSCGDAEAARITASGVSILVLPEGADFSALPQNWLTPDAAVLESPKNIASGFDVLSVDAEDLPQALKSETGSCCATGGAGNIVIDFKGNRKISVRRET